ncbi:hypothetical protein [Saccharopolyspora sp. CA-218241]|uniref:hypothetical protein n=1 Tax=Saccharopolyspora sp. CA-218241 TaxID=3240027 RepID=UPI003D964311
MRGRGFAEPGGLVAQVPGVLVALHRQRPARVVGARVVGVAPGDLAQRRGQLGLGVVQLAQQRGDLAPHGCSTLLTRTAATL